VGDDFVIKHRCVFDYDNIVDSHRGYLRHHGSTEGVCVRMTDSLQHEPEGVLFLFKNLDFQDLGTPRAERRLSWAGFGKFSA
jgi:hypothetical protein